MPKLDTINVTALPAKAVFELWRKMPQNTSKSADFRFIISLD
jgi:hypothetical protein